MRQNRIVAQGTPVAVMDLALMLGLISVDVLARILPHAPNFVPIAASALFAGVVFRMRPLAFVVPLAAMAVSDCVLGFYDWRVMIVVYTALTVPAALGLLACRFRLPLVVFPLAVSSSVIFFLATNFAVWMFSGMYVHNLAGLGMCYIAALPFFENALMGDLFWTTILFGGLWIFRFTFATRRANILLAADLMHDPRLPVGRALSH
jgi:hypothetical protein